MKWHLFFFVFLLVLISLKVQASIGSLGSSNLSSVNLTSGSGLVIEGNIISATAINGTGAGGNSNETLWGMFANKTQIQKNETIEHTINQSKLFNIQILWTNILSIPAYVKDWTNDFLTINRTIMNNETIANALLNTTIVRPVELQTINATIMNNETINNMIGTAISPTNASINSNATLWSMFANISNINSNTTINNMIDARVTASSGSQLSSPNNLTYIKIIDRKIILVLE